MKEDKSSKNNKNNTSKELQTDIDFGSAYSIRGRGVGKLELKKAAASSKFKFVTKDLVHKLNKTYSKGDMKKAN